MGCGKKVFTGYGSKQGFKTWDFGDTIPEKCKIMNEYIAKNANDLELAALGVFRYGKPEESTGKPPVWGCHSSLPGGMSPFTNYKFGIPGGTTDVEGMPVGRDWLSIDGAGGSLTGNGFDLSHAQPNEMAETIAEGDDGQDKALQTEPECVMETSSGEKVAVDAIHAGMTLTTPEHPSCGCYQCCSKTLPNRNKNLPTPAAPHCFPSKMYLPQGPAMHLNGTVINSGEAVDFCKGPAIMDDGSTYWGPVDEGSVLIHVNRILASWRMRMSGDWPSVADANKLKNEQDLRCSLDSIPCPNHRVVKWLLEIAARHGCNIHFDSPVPQVEVSPSDVVTTPRGSSIGVGVGNGVEPSTCGECMCQEQSGHSDCETLGSTSDSPIDGQPLRKRPRIGVVTTEVTPDGKVRKFCAV